MPHASETGAGKVASIYGDGFCQFLELLSCVLGNVYLQAMK